jgi:hypothetical protein
MSDQTWCFSDDTPTNLPKQTYQDPEVSTDFLGLIFGRTN